MNKNIKFIQLFIISRLVQYWYFLLKSIFFPLIKIFFWDKSVSSVTDFTSRSGQRKICHSKSFVPSKEKTSVESILVLGHIYYSRASFSSSLLIFIVFEMIPIHLLEEECRILELVVTGRPRHQRNSLVPTLSTETFMWPIQL